MEYEDVETFTIDKLRNRLNNLPVNNLQNNQLDIIVTDIKQCHNDESALTLEELNIDDTIISIPVNGFKYCYTINELIGLIENAMNQYKRANPEINEVNIDDITVRDLYTNVEISNDILKKVYNYYYHNDNDDNYDDETEGDSIKKIFMDAIYTYDDDFDELQNFMIEMIKNNRDLVINAKYKFNSNFEIYTALQKVCEKNFTKVAMYILDNFTPTECMLNNVNNQERTALIYAIKNIYDKDNENDLMYKVVMKILDYTPDENNLFYISSDLYDNKTALMVACYNNLTNVALKILEKKPPISYINVRSPPSEYNQEALSDEYSTHDKSAVDYAVNNDMEQVLNKLVELYGSSIKRERKSNMYGYVDDLYGYDSRLLEFQPRGHLGGKVIRFKRKSSKKRKSRKRSSKRTSKK